MFKNINKILKYVLFLVAVLVSISLAYKEVETVFKVAHNIPKDRAKKNLPIYSVDREDNNISISFDATWGVDETKTLLKILKNYNIKSTFFLCGYWIDKYPQEVKMIFDDGHDIGNHGDTHAHHAKIGLEENKREILNVHRKIKDILGIDMNLFRPPFGEYNDTVINAANELGYHTIQWDIDSHDWMEKGMDYEINRVLENKNLKNGSIILFHNDAKDTPKTLPIIIEGLKKKGYNLVPISQLIHRDNYYMDYYGRQKLLK